MERILTPDTVEALGAIVAAWRTGAKVARVTDRGVIKGTARMIGDTNGSRAWSDDIRDCHLRVTTVGGWEEFWPIAELIPEVASGEFVVGYE
jgi:hypothetical protein